MNLTALSQCISQYGLLQGSLFFIKVKLKLQEKFYLPTCEHPIWIRKGTTDFLVFEQVFLLQEYNIALSNEINFIIDLGANVGYSAVYFAERFKNTKILCIEPEPENFKILKLNTAPYPSVSCLNTAIWNESTKLTISGHQHGNWGFITNVDSNGSKEDQINATTIPNLVEKYKISIIDVLKIDIEGSEAELFSSGYENWLPLVKVLIIEFHDHLKPLSSKNVLKAINHYNFTRFQKGENHVFVNNNLS